MSDCISPRTGKPLSGYKTREAAEASASHQKRKNGAEYHVYRCDRCGLYHLSPNARRVIPTRGICSCKDSNGNIKNLYCTRDDAFIVKERAERQRNVKLYIYECPEGLGWHLAHYKEDERAITRCFQRLDNIPVPGQKKYSTTEDKQSQSSSAHRLISRMKSEYRKATAKERQGLFIFISACILLTAAVCLIRCL